VTRVQSNPTNTDVSCHDALRHVQHYGEHSADVTLRYKALAVVLVCRGGDDEEAGTTWEAKQQIQSQPPTARCCMAAAVLRTITILFTISSNKMVVTTLWLPLMPHGTVASPALPPCVSLLGLELAGPSGWSLVLALYNSGAREVVGRRVGRCRGGRVRCCRRGCSR
jgi:hypothetical protein